MTTQQYGIRSLVTLYTIAGNATCITTFATAPHLAAALCDKADSPLEGGSGTQGTAQERGRRFDTELGKG